MRKTDELGQDGSDGSAGNAQIEAINEDRIQNDVQNAAKTDADHGKRWLFAPARRILFST